jgi:hypothetical protein
VVPTNRTRSHWSDSESADSESLAGTRLALTTLTSQFCWGPPVGTVQTIAGDESYGYADGVGTNAVLNSLQGFDLSASDIFFVRAGTGTM